MEAETTTNSETTQSPKGTLLVSGQEVPFSLPLVNALNPINLILLVPGTTDPINTGVGADHDSNSGTYFNNTEKGIGFYNSLMNSIKAKIELEFPQASYPDLIVVENSKFTWSGDNSREERAKGGAILVDLVMNDYKHWSDREVYIHLIGHSHGGNVINEFTHQITERSDFPETWSIKSILYMSVPFFSNSHQVNESKLNSECKIHNIINHFDITQRVIADHSVIQLATFFDDIQKDSRLVTAKNYISNVEFAAFEDLKTALLPLEWAKTIWRNVGYIVEAIDLLLSLITEKITHSQNGANVLKLNTVLKEVKDWIVSIKPNLIATRAKIEEDLSGFDIPIPWYWPARLISDLNLETKLVSLVNSVMEVENDPDSSFLMAVLEDILVRGNVQLFTEIDDTYSEPTRQFSKFQGNISHEPITNDDPYKSRSNSANYNGFIRELEDLVKSGLGGSNGLLQSNFKEILFLLLSQFKQYDQSNILTKISSNILKINIGSGVLSYAPFFPLLGKIKLIELNWELAKLGNNLKKYERLIERYNKNLIANSDLTSGKSILDTPGNIAYLAMKSHNLSRTFMTDATKHFLEYVIVKPEVEES